MSATATPSSDSPERRRPPRARIGRVLGGFGVLTALATLPPVAEHTYALGPLHPDVRAPLWFVSVFAALTCLAMTRWLAPRRPAAMALLLPLIALVWVEIGARFTVQVAAPELHEKLVRLAVRTFPDQAAMRGHPFLQFTARPAQQLRGNEFFGGLGKANPLGFFGKLPPRAKPTDTIRVACVGGSTTARGYPRVLEKILRRDAKQRLGREQKFEVMNFGMGYWTSAHTLVNFMLNVVHYQPDYVVILHGWNDQRALRATPRAFRTDYSHAFKPFDPAEAPDRWLLRASVLYRWAADKVDPAPKWTGMIPATQHPFPRAGKIDPAQYEPFTSNLRSIVQHSVLRGATPVLMTMPHCTDEKIPFYGQSAKAIEQFAKLTRLLHERELSELALLVDLDAEITGKHDELFIDVGHMTKAGIERKASAVAEVVFTHLSAK